MSYSRLTDDTGWTVSGPTVETIAFFFHLDPHDAAGFQRVADSGELSAEEIQLLRGAGLIDQHPQASAA